MVGLYSEDDGHNNTKQMGEGRAGSTCIQKKYLAVSIEDLRTATRKVVVPEEYPGKLRGMKQVWCEPPWFGANVFTGQKAPPKRDSERYLASKAILGGQDSKT